MCDHGCAEGVQFRSLGGVHFRSACGLCHLIVCVLAGHDALLSATKAVLGEAKPYSLTGSLPLVKELQDEGFDLQIVGYGLMKTYRE